MSRALLVLSLLLGMIACEREAPTSPAEVSREAVSHLEPARGDALGFAIEGQREGDTRVGRWRAWHVLPGPPKIHPVVASDGHVHEPDERAVKRRVESALAVSASACARGEPWDEGMREAGVEINVTATPTGPVAVEVSRATLSADRVERCVTRALEGLRAEELHATWRATFSVGFHNSRFVPAAEGVYEAGAREGAWRFFDPRGRLIAAGRYEDGRPSGLWILTREAPSDTRRVVKAGESVAPLEMWPEGLEAAFGAVP